LAQYFRDEKWQRAFLTRTEYSLSFHSRDQVDFLPASTHFSVLYTGRLHVPVGGTVLFALESHDGSTLYIDGQRVVDDGGVHKTARKEGIVPLTAGPHELAVLFFNAEGVAVLRVYWRLPGGPWEILPLASLVPVKLAWATRLTGQRPACPSHS
jgi:hypothetical protein